MKVFKKSYRLILGVIIMIMIVSTAVPAYGASGDVYTYENDTYKFALTIPDKYKDKVFLVENDNWINIIHKDSFLAECGGNLFSIIVVGANDTDTLNSTLSFSVGIVERTDEFVYVLYTPTDVRFSTETREEYQQIYDSFVIFNAGSKSLAPNVFKVIEPSTDNPSDWAKADVNKAIEANLVPDFLQSGYNTATTRAEFAAIVVTLYEQVTGTIITERKTFDDTTDANVQKAAAIGVVNGVGENKFDPNVGLTREQAATVLSRLANAIGKPLASNTATFADNSSVSTWAIEAVGQMQATGIMGGVGNNAFDPKGAYTREQSIVTTMRLYNALKGGDTAEPTNGSIDLKLIGY